MSRQITQLEPEALAVISQALEVAQDEISDIAVMKKGMTNRSFLFTCKDKKYILRISGEGTEQIVNRFQEAAVYEIIADKHICDNIIYINPHSGYKITEFIEGARVCDPRNINDIEKCMAKLREFHNMNLTVGHEFDIFAQIEFYERLRDGSSAYEDYDIIKHNIYKLKDYIDAHVEKKILTHIDAVPDNFLFAGDGEVLLIDWEYAGMQDPHVDIAMFCIYSLYDKKQIDQLIDLYFAGKCPKETRIKIYCYIASCGLLWSNWCEYKRKLGIEFGEYAFRQYCFAKDYYEIVKREFVGGINKCTE